MRIYKRIICVVLLLALLIVPPTIITPVRAEGNNIENAKAQEAAYYRTHDKIEIKDIDIGAFSRAANVTAGTVPEITSPTAILIEASTGGILFEKDADVRRSPASVTKIMTELLTIEAVEAGVITLDDVVTTSRHAAGMGGSQIFLRQGETMTVRDMLKGVVINSANDAAVALAEHLAGSEEAFVASMNARAADLGMKNTNFTNCSGLLEPDEHYTTVRDISLMARELLSHDLIREFTTIWMDSLRNGETMLANTNRLVRYFDGTTGLKTGFTNLAGHCLAASARREGVEYISVTLGDKTSQERFESARLLLSYAFATYTVITVTTDSVLPPVKVDLGVERFVQPEIDAAVGIHLTRAAAAKVEKIVTLAPQLLAPVIAGDEIGRLEFRVDDEIIAEFPIIAANSSERLGWGDIFTEFLGMLVAPPEG